MAAPGNVRVSGVCGTSPDAGRWALIALGAAAAITVLGLVLIGMHTLPVTMLLGAALVLGTQIAHPIEVGADGLAFIGRRGSFISHAEIETIEETDDGAILRCRNGRHLKLIGVHRSRLDPVTMAGLRSLVLHHWCQPRSPFAIPARGVLPIAEWFDSVRSSAAACSDRRALLAAVEEPALPALLRAAAALLLRDFMTADERAGIAHAARVTVARPLKRVLELVASGALEDEILSAIDALAPGASRSLERRRSISADLARASVDFRITVDQLLSRDWQRRPVPYLHQNSAR
jgi:hypothetical protein